MKQNFLLLISANLLLSAFSCSFSFSRQHHSGWKTRLAISTAENSLPNKDLSIVFDLDEPLVFDDCIFHEKNENLNVPLTFEGKQIICDSHVIPGVYEMLQYVKVGKKQQIAFFSAGVKERNEALVPLLLKNAFPIDHEWIVSESPIFSRHHQNSGKKDLQVVADHYKNSMKTPIPLDDIFLIDNYPRVVGKGQNALSVLPPKGEDQNRIFYTT
jgi:hypothetical protein